MVVMLVFDQLDEMNLWENVVQFLHPAPTTALHLT